MPHEANVDILLVDVQRENLLTLEVMLDSLGQNLVKAHSGEEALRYLLEQDFAVILLNAQMPGMDRFEIVRLIREKPASQHTPIILIAACNQDDIDIESGYSLGIVDYLKKPIAPSLLRAKVEVFVSLFKKIEESKQKAAQLKADNKELQREIANRQRAEEVVRQSKERYRLLLESIPHGTEEEERTTQLSQLNEQLLAEIVERQQVEIALRESEQQYHTLLETIPYGIEEIDTTGIITFSNSAHHRMLGYREGELLGKPIWDLVPESERLNLSEYLTMLVQDQPPPTAYLGKNLSKDGNLIDIQVDWNYKRDEFGRVTGFISVVTDITQRQQAEQALRRSQARYRAIIEDQTELICRFLPDGTLTFVNQAYCFYFGKRSEELIGQSFFAFIPDEDRDIPQQHFSFLSIANPVVTCEHRVITPNGEIRWQQWTDRALFDEQGNFVEFQAVGRDITKRKQAELALQQLNQQLELRVHERTAELQQTLEQLQAEVKERRQAEEALRASEALFKAIVQHSYDIITLVDENDNMWYQSPSAYRVMGYSSEQLPKKRPVQKVHPEDIPKVQSAMAAILAQPGVPVTVEYRMQRVDGSWAWLESVGTNWLANPDIRAVVANTRDMSDRKQVEEALRQARDELEIRVQERTVELILINASLQAQISDRVVREQQLRAIFECALDAIAIVDDKSTYVEANSAASNLFGLPLTELLGKRVADFMEPGFDVELAWRTFQEQGQSTGELRLLRPDGTVRDVEYAAKANFLPGRHLSVLRDITEQKQAEEMRRALEAEKELRRLQLRFFSMVSHEFRTPLSTILGSAQLLKSYTQAWSEEKKSRNLNRIETAAKNMTQLLDDLLTINRAETGKLEFHPRPIELETFCHQLVEDIQFHAGSKHQITFVCHGQCPKVSLDEKLLRSILTNLLSNAVKYSPQGGEVNFTLTCEQSEAIFQIQDQGIGIPPEDQQHLFELFHRGNNIENIPGTGLGLSVVKKCLELQRGKISITSEVGIGTTVTVTIPLNLFMGIP